MNNTEIATLWCCCSIIIRNAIRRVQGGDVINHTNDTSTGQQPFNAQLVSVWLLFCIYVHVKCEMQLTLAHFKPEHHVKFHYHAARSDLENNNSRHSLNCDWLSENIQRTAYIWPGEWRETLSFWLKFQKGLELTEVDPVSREKCEKKNCPVSH